MLEKERGTRAQDTGRKKSITDRPFQVRCKADSKCLNGGASLGPVLMSMPDRPGAEMAVNRRIIHQPSSIPHRPPATDILMLRRPFAGESLGVGNFGRSHLGGGEVPVLERHIAEIWFRS